MTIGNFDGIHLGHCVVINRLVELGTKLQLPVIILLFEPQPLEYFLGDRAPSRLMRFREKAMYLAAMPVDQLVMLRFNQQLADFNADQFINEILIGKLNVKHLVIGDDFHFGKARCGDFALLQQAGKTYDFQVEDTDSIVIDGQRVSSTLIREALQTGDLALAKQMLGRDYSVCGRVIQGDQRGRQLGFPTANIQLHRHNTPVNGVYVINITGIDDKTYYGVANVGSRPTIAGSTEVILEAHLFDFNQEIYGRYVHVHFKRKIRNEICFHSLEHLRTQISQDVLEAKKIIAELTFKDGLQENAQFT